MDGLLRIYLRALETGQSPKSLGGIRLNMMQSRLLPMHRIDGEGRTICIHNIGLTWAGQPAAGVIIATAPTLQSLLFQVIRRQYNLFGLSLNFPPPAPLSALNSSRLRTLVTRYQQNTKNCPVPTSEQSVTFVNSIATSPLGMSDCVRFSISTNGTGGHHGNTKKHIPCST